MEVEEFMARIAIKVRGDGEGSVDGVISFDPFYQMTRAALLLDWSAPLASVKASAPAFTQPYHAWL